MSDILSPRTKKPLINADYVRSILRYDPETGLIHWLTTGTGRKPSLIAGSRQASGYWVTGIKNRIYKNHQLALLLATGRWPEHDVDHINGVKEDNRLCNLREVDHQINTQNRLKAHSNNVSGLLGAHKRKQRFIARILVNGTPHYLGTYQTAEEAHEAYINAKRSLHPGNTL